MTEYNSANESKTTTGRSFPIAVGVAVGAIALAIGSHVYQSQEIDKLNTGIQGMQAVFDSRLADAQARVESAGSSSVQSLDSLRQELEAARKDSAVGVRTARAARHKADQLAAGLADERKEHLRFANDLTEIKESATQSTSRLSDISNDVGTVKTDLGQVKSDFAMTRSDVEKTLSDLKRMNGDMGVMSGLIATNSKELTALRDLGDRNYYNFDLTKTKTPQRVGDILLQVKKTDPKRNRFTVEVIADDKRMEKKDKTVNEPVQFYVVSKARQPYEIVVNEVKPNRLVGYLATPKVQVARK